MIIRLDSEPDIIDKVDNDLKLEPEKEQSANEIEEKSKEVDVGVNLPNMYLKDIQTNPRFSKKKGNIKSTLKKVLV